MILDVRDRLVAARSNSVAKSEERETVGENALRGGEDGKFEERTAQGGSGGARVEQRQWRGNFPGKTRFRERQIDIGGFLP